MKRIHIFKAGTHTSSSGSTLEFTEDALQAAVDAYDPQVHEAPIVVGHPKDNGPAFGWIAGLDFDEGNIFAAPSQVNEDFAELVEKGTYKKVSASWYTPDAPSNPAPGSFYLRHVGFLGAQPPAIKGLGEIEFSEDEEGVVEFSADWETAGIFRRLREFLIEKFGIEDADKAIPGYLVESTEDVARNPKTPTADDSLAYYSEENAMTPEELKAAQDKLAADRAALKAEQDALESQKTEFTEQQTAAEAVAIAERKAKIGERVDGLVKAGKITPAQAPGVKDFAEKIDQGQTVEFGEGDEASAKDGLDFFFGLLEAGKSPVDFGEHGAPGGGSSNGEVSAEDLAAQAVEYQEECRKNGRTVSTTEAVNYVQNNPRG